MKTCKKHPDSLILLMIKLSIFFMLCLMVVNALNAMAQPTKFRNAGNSVQAIQQKIREIYISQIGIREKPSNSGPDVEKYLRYVNLPKGNPWCAAFVCWVYGRAGVPNPRTGWSPGLFRTHKVIWVRTTEKGKLKTEVLRKGAHSSQPIAPSPQTGDVFGLFFPEKDRIAHVGFVDQWDGTWLITVEGNTNVSGSREGDGVYRKRRLVKSIYRVARYVK